MTGIARGKRQRRFCFRGRFLSPSMFGTRNDFCECQLVFIDNLGTVQKLRRVVPLRARFVRLSQFFEIKFILHDSAVYSATVIIYEPNIMTKRVTKGEWAAYSRLCLCIAINTSNYKSFFCISLVYIISSSLIIYKLNNAFRMTRR